MGKDLEERDRGTVQYLPGETEENHNKISVNIAGV
jgi:hypothetical protein